MEQELNQSIPTKEKILYESLKLFSANGYEAVSTRMIARATGMSDTVIYKHFKNKQEIFDLIIEKCKERFLTELKKTDIHTINWKDVEKICMEIFRFQIEDEWIVMFRKLLIVEQFKNPEMAELYKSFFIDIAVNGQTRIFQELIEEGYMKKCNPKVLAIEMYAPFFMYHTVHEDREELFENLKEHVSYFRKNYRTSKCD